jgi:hypothetical protein
VCFLGLYLGVRPNLQLLSDIQQTSTTTPLDIRPENTTTPTPTSKSKTPPVHLTQVTVALLARVERRQAHPAEVGTAPAAGHVVAAVRFFHGRLAAGAVFDAELFLGLGELLAAAGAEFAVVGAGLVGVRRVAGCAGWD